MRLNALALAATLVAGAVLPTASQAQTLDRILGLVSAGTSFGWNSCSYVQGGLQSAACQGNRAVNAINVVRQTQLSSDWRRSERLQRQSRLITALQRACANGDERSCERSGGSDPRDMQVAQALGDACYAGDRESCRRADDMLRADRPRTAARPVRTASAALGCRPVVDPRTGYRVAGRTECR